MAQQEKPPGCFKFRKGRKKIEPEPLHNSRRLEEETTRPNEPQVLPSEQNQERREESQDLEDDSTNGVNSGLADGLEGRTNAIPDKEFQERNNALRTTEETEQASQLKAEQVDFHKDENREAHRTDDYEIEQLIVRRGQTFDVTVTFNREYKPDEDVILLQFVTGNRPQESKGSIIRVSVQDTLTPTRWGMQEKNVTGNTVRLSIMSSARAIIGRYDVFVETKSKDSSGEVSLCRYKNDEQVCVLFNAWCEDDAVFMESDESRHEYVLEDFGYIWKGVSGQVEKIPWTFGQFEDVALNSSLYLLDKAGLSSTARVSPILVIRTISAMANSNDKDGGILSGRWSNSFPDGTTAPLAWTGSTAILEEFWKTKKVVRYGQCWVFSGVVTSLSRALGIPTRSVTNFDSAHDSDGSMTIDYHFDEEGDIIGHMNDSVWNYHVWNESWFKRPDLPAGHDGWQAHDATPQETSGGVFRCGPASVKAIKNGEVYLPYDTSFVFAEVNGDRVYWEVKQNDDSMKPTNVDKKSIGNSVSTKAIGSASREDITHEYKHPEGSEEERNAVEFAFQFSSRTEHDLYESDVHDVDFTLDVEDNINVGSNFDAVVVVKNKSDKTRSIKVNFAAVLSFYTGVPAKKLKRYKVAFLLNSQAEKRLVLTIEASDYISKSSVESTIKLYVKGSVEDTGQSFATQDAVELKKPELTVKASPSLVHIKDDVDVIMSFKNPLPVPLTNGQFHLEATRMTPKSMVINCRGPVGSNEEAKVSAVVTAARKGNNHIVVSFQSNELSGVRGECTVVTQVDE